MLAYTKATTDGLGDSKDLIFTRVIFSETGLNGADPAFLLCQCIQCIGSHPLQNLHQARFRLTGRKENLVIPVFVPEFLIADWLV